LVQIYVPIVWRYPFVGWPLPGIATGLGCFNTCLLYHPSHSFSVPGYGPPRFDVFFFFLRLFLCGESHFPPTPALAKLPLSHAFCCLSRYRQDLDTDNWRSRLDLLPDYSPLLRSILPLSPRLFATSRAAESIIPARSPPFFIPFPFGFSWSRLPCAALLRPRLVWKQKICPFPMGSLARFFLCRPCLPSSF